MKKTQVYHTSRSLEVIVPELAAWLETSQQYPLPERSERGETIVLRTKLTGVIRQIGGLVFELTVELTPTGDGFVAVVDNGDLRNQLVALGIAWFIFWPLLLSSAWARFASNAVLDEVLKKLQELSVSEVAGRIVAA